MVLTEIISLGIFELVKQVKNLLTKAVLCNAVTSIVGCNVELFEGIIAEISYLLYFA